MKNPLGSGPGFSHAHVLLIDDDLEQLELMYQIIHHSKLPIKVWRANHPRAALEILDRHPIHLIVSDWAMPDMQGLELIQALQANPKLAEIPVIICTGVMTTPEHHALILDHGAVDFLRKPINDVEFLARLRSMLQLSEARRLLQESLTGKDQMFYTIAHQLIENIGQLEMILETVDSLWPQDTKNAKHFLGHALKMSGTAKNTLETILAWARYRFLSVPLDLQPIKLRHLFEMIASQVKPRQVRLRCQHDLTLLTDIDFLLPLLSSLFQQLAEYCEDQILVLRAVQKETTLKITLEGSLPEHYPDPPILIPNANRPLTPANIRHLIAHEQARYLKTQITFQRKKETLAISLELADVLLKAKQPMPTA